MDEPRPAAPWDLLSSLPPPQNKHAGTHTQTQPSTPLTIAQDLAVQHVHCGIGHARGVQDLDHGVGEAAHRHVPGALDEGHHRVLGDELVDGGPELWGEAHPRPGCGARCKGCCVLAGQLGEPEHAAWGMPSRDPATWHSSPHCLPPEPCPWHPQAPSPTTPPHVPRGPADGTRASPLQRMPSKLSGRTLRGGACACMKAPAGRREARRGRGPARLLPTPRHTPGRLEATEIAAMAHF